MADHLTLAVLMQKIGYTSRKASIPTILVLFVKDAYLLPENVLMLTKITTIKNNEVVVKTSLFWERTIVVTRENKAKVEGIMSTLYNVNIQICKEKDLNAYYQLDPSFIWYVNIVECQKHLILVCFIYSNVFRLYHNNNNTCFVICLY